MANEVLVNWASHCCECSLALLGLCGNLMPEFVVLHILYCKIDSRFLGQSVDEKYKLRRQKFKSFSPIVVHTQPIVIMADMLNISVVTSCCSGNLKSRYAFKVCKWWSIVFTSITTLVLAAPPMSLLITKHNTASIFHRSCRSSTLYCAFITLHAGSIMNSVSIDSLIPSSTLSSRVVHLHSFKSNVYRMLLQSSSIRFILNLIFYFVCKYYATENNIVINDCIIVTNVLLNDNDGLRWMKRAKLQLQPEFCHYDNQWLFVLRGPHIYWTHEWNNVIGRFILLVWALKRVWCVLNTQSLVNCYGGLTTRHVISNM